ncbi:MAG: TIGR03905 family TSCPD domain-containing protein [Oscillospiraceae bacterium]|nr:TIGR03905 family TSCPD domain-containing protein [Oscillospiraceae bacterium]
MIYTYRPKGVCSQKMIIELEDGIIKNVEVLGGCHGNLQGISALVRGMRAEDAIARMRGIRCGFKNTSCPDQMSKALEEALQQ